MYVYVHVDVFFHIPPQVISPVAAIPKPGSHASVQRTVGATRIYQATVDQRLFINCINPRTLGYTRLYPVSSVYQCEWYQLHSDLSLLLGVTPPTNSQGLFSPGLTLPMHISCLCHKLRYLLTRTNAGLLDLPFASIRNFTSPEFSDT